MKMVRVDLLAEGRSDIASKVRAYRGGYSREVVWTNNISSSVIVTCARLAYRTDVQSKEKHLQAIC